MPRDEQVAIPAVAETELAAYRSRLEAKLAARRTGARLATALGSAGRPAAGRVATGYAVGTASFPTALVAAILVATGAVAAGVFAWPLLPDPPALVEARAALALERARNQHLADELRATVRALRAQAMALADHDAREAEIDSLREELKQAGDIAVMRDHFLAEAQDRIRQLQVPPEPTVAQPAGSPTVASPAPVTLPTADPPDADLPKLMARARLLLGQGDIGGARAVLERATASGNALALFALAETYDPAILARWGTRGTRGDVARAQALYQQARAAGVEAAAERLAVLQ